MGIFRQASIDPQTIKLYAAKLVNFDLGDLQDACKRIEDLPRGEGETAFPEIGAVRSMVEICRNARLNRVEAEMHKALVRWRCPDCSLRMSGWVARGDTRERRCKSTYGPWTPWNPPAVPAKRTFLPEGQICGALMIVIHDEGQF
jgi:hypothetical protein